MLCGKCCSSVWEVWLRMKTCPGCSADAIPGPVTQWACGTWQGEGDPGPTWSPECLTRQRDAAREREVADARNRQTDVLDYDDARLQVEQARRERDTARAEAEAARRREGRMLDLLRRARRYIRYPHPSAGRSQIQQDQADVDAALSTDAPSEPARPLVDADELKRRVERNTVTQADVERITGALSEGEGDDHGRVVEAEQRVIQAAFEWLESGRDEKRKNDVGQDDWYNAHASKCDALMDALDDLSALRGGAS